MDGHYITYSSLIALTYCRYAHHLRIVDNTRPSHKPYSSHSRFSPAVTHSIVVEIVFIGLPDEHGIARNKRPLPVMPSFKFSPRRPASLIDIKAQEYCKEKTGARGASTMYLVTFSAIA